MTYTAGFAELGGGDVAAAGGKGANLGELSRAGLPVPPGFVLTTAAYGAVVEAGGFGARILALVPVGDAADPSAGEDAASQIRALFTDADIPEAVRAPLFAAYAGLTDNRAAAVAVRSSATAEDLPGASFAGQQETYLNVRGPEALLAAVRQCWASLWTARAMGYRGRQGIDPASVSLAVVVQCMVEAEAAGVMFTANPVNGRRTETAISAAWGLGESVVGGSVNTDELVVATGTGRVLSRVTADKTVMTVYADSGGTAERPVSAQRRGEPVLDDEAAAELAGLGARIAAHFGRPQDVEWARAGGELFVVQARPITALPEPEADPPTDWTVPDPKGYYFRASIVEQLPDPLSPLFADMVDPAVTRSLQALFAEVFGDASLGGGELGLPTVNGYAYYHYGRAGMWRMVANSPAALRAIYAGDAGQVAGVRGWRDRSHPRYRQLVGRWRDRPVDDLTTEGLLTGVRELLDGGCEYYTAVQSIIPLAASAEVLLTWFYNGLLRRAGDPPAHQLLLGFDSTPISAEKSLYDLATWSRDQGGLAGVLLGEPSPAVLDRMRGGQPPTTVDAAVWEQWRARFQAHLDRFGHTVYNLDFVNPVPADDPATLLDTLRFYLRGQAANPHERQRRLARGRDTAAAALRGRLDPARRAVFEQLLAWAQDTAPVREDALAGVGLAWPVMRRMLAELGHRLADAGAIDVPAEVFWLRHDELVALARDLDAGRRHLDPHTAAVAERQALWRGRKRVTPPQLLPKSSRTLKLAEGFMPAGSEEQTGGLIRGTAASAGQVTATARVLSGPQDFARMQPGDVLVAAITTPAWTSLFPLASAVVTDVGGPLSHSSIVAREYGIPAVLGTAVATRRITDGERVRVDGDAGTVTLLDRTDQPDPPAPAGSPSRRRMAVVGAALAMLGAATWLWRSRRH